MLSDKGSPAGIKSPVKSREQKSARTAGRWGPTTRIVGGFPEALVLTFLKNKLILTKVQSLSDKLSEQETSLLDKGV